jgi:hypothetical protein
MKLLEEVYIEEVVREHIEHYVRGVITEVTSSRKFQFTIILNQSLKDKGLNVKYVKDKKVDVDVEDGKELIDKLVHHVMCRLVK